MPQTVSTTLAIIQAITPSSVSLGLPLGAVQEFVFVGEIIVRSTTNNWQITSVTSLTGGRYNQVSTPSATIPGLSQVLGAGNDANTLQIINLANGTSANHAINLGQTLWNKTVTIEAPTSADDITIFRTDVAITVREVIAVSTGTTPSTTYVLRHGTDRDDAGTLVTTSASTTSKTTGDTATLSDATIPADSWVWLETTDASGTGVTLSVDIRYTID